MLHDNLYDHEPYWRQHFRLSRETFRFLVQLLRGSIEKRNTRLREAVGVEMRVAVALWRLSTGNSYRTVASTFGIGKSTAVTITNDVIESLVEYVEDWIKFPQTIQETAESINRFSDKNNSPLPQVVGAIDGSQIPIKAPKQSKESYFNRKQFYSMNLQGVVGGDCRFLDVAVGFPGSIHDARVLRMSGIYGRVLRREILQGPVHNLNGIPVGPLIIGDSAYPGLPWLVKPYQNEIFTQSQKKFNNIHSKARVVVERTFGIMKARWRCLLKQLEIHTENVPKTVLACCILHNICIMRGEPDPELVENDDDDDDDDDDHDDGDDSSANDIRDTIRSYLDNI